MHICGKNTRICTQQNENTSSQTVQRNHESFASSFPERTFDVEETRQHDVYTLRKYMTGPGAQRNFRFPSQGACQHSIKIRCRVIHVVAAAAMHFTRVRGPRTRYHFLYVVLFMNI